MFEPVEHQSERAKAAGVTAAELMTAPAVTIGPQELVAAAARRMHDRGVKQLPVVDRSGALIGMVTRADLLKAFRRSDDEIRVDVLDHVAGDLLGLPSGRSRSRPEAAWSASVVGSPAAARHGSLRS